MIPYLGDFAEDDTVYVMLNTFTSDDPSASCTITNFVNTDVHIHKDDDTTQRNNAAGITVSTNFDGITGSHMIKIDTNDNTVAGFWVTGKDYFVRIEGTTVDGATINAVVAHFSIQNRYTRGTDSASTHTAANVWTVGTRALTDKSGFALSAAGANLILKDSLFALAMADANWDEILTGATHNIATSAGRRVREIGAFAIHSGTATAGNGFSITLAATASANDGVYNRNLIVLVDNTGAGQTRTIVDYDATSKICVVDREWRVSPDVTTEYQIVPDDTPLTVDHGRARGGTATTITLRAYASTVDDTYLCNQIGIIAGPGRGQSRLVGAYDGTSKIVTICGDDWVTTPTTDSIYVMMPYGTTCTSCIGDHALGLIKSEADDAISDVALDTHDQNMKAILFSELV